MTLSLVSTEASVRTHWSLSDAPVLKATPETAARHQLTGADGLIPVKMGAVVAKKMRPLFVTALVACLDDTVTSPEFPVRRLQGKEVSKQMNSAIMVVTVSTLGQLTFVNVRLTTLAAIVKAKWTTVRTSLVTMAPPVGDMWEDINVTVCQASLARTVRSRSTSVSLIHVKMEAPALT